MTKIIGRSLFGQEALKAGILILAAPQIKFLRLVKN